MNKLLKSVVLVTIFVTTGILTERFDVSRQMSAFMFFMMGNLCQYFE